MPRLAVRAVVGTAVTAAALGTPWWATRRPLRRRLFPALSGLGTIADHVALTFHDGRAPASTPRILDALQRLDWRATFFMLGEMVERHPGMAAEVAAAGHEVAVHGYRHRTHLFRAPAELRDDVARATDAVALATDRVPTWFRPPYGTIGWGTPAAAHRAGLRVVLWSAWGRDWRARATATDVVRDVAAGLAPGATVLLHDSDCTSAAGSWRSTLDALPGLADVFDRHRLRPGPLADHGLPTAGWPVW
jgi:peptidoglycan/xylan/chitin deacetylase (PgdA/CDA1 family)